MEKLRQLKPDKSPGIDQVHPYVLRECCEEMAVPSFMICKKSLDEGRIPKDWKVARVTISKKVSKNKQTNKQKRPKNKNKQKNNNNNNNKQTKNKTKQTHKKQTNKQTKTKTKTKNKLIHQDHREDPEESN